MKVDKNDKKLILVYLALTSCMLFWGLSFIWTKIVLEAYKPVTIILLRLIISSVLLIGIGIILKKLQPITRREFKNVVILAFFQPFLYFIFENYGLKEVSSTVASVIISTIPLFSPVAAHVFLKEKATVINIIGIVLSIIGVIMVILKDNFGLKVSVEGVLLLFGAVIAAIIYSVIISKDIYRGNIYSLITYQNSIGIIFFLPVFFVFDYREFSFAYPGTNVISALLALSVLASTLAFIFVTYGIKNFGITKSNAFTNVIPVFTAFFAWLFLDEHLSLINILGILIVIAGLFLVQSKRKIRKITAFRFRRG